MYNKQNSKSFSNISATTAPFTMRGGNYGITVTAGANWGGGSVGLQRLSADGSTFVDVVTPFTADGMANINLPPGTYQITVATATGVYVDVTSVVVTQ
jgi:hypothetical protein